MEAPEYLLPSGPHRAGSGQFSEKQGKVVGGCEHFMVEDLLDFSNEDDGLGGGEVLEDGLVIDMASGNSADSSTVTAMDCSSNSGSDPRFPNEPIGLTGELCVPYDDLEELEWLSSFVEESFSSEDLQKLQLISGVKYTSSSEARSEVCTIPTTRATPTVAAAANTSTPTPTPTTIFVPEKPVCSKARSKRSRAAPCSWASRIVVLSHNNATPTSSADDSDLLPPPPSDIPPAKKAPKTVKKKETHDVLAPAPDGRKCLHCATDKTPQWRTGPMGPKTLCNACGVRYKSGRLVPEYRPAASPTFVLSKHSNSHRKVMELRRQKELLQQQHSAQFLHHHSHHQLSPIYDMVTGGADEFLIHHQVGPDFRQLI